MIFTRKLWIALNCLLIVIPSVTLANPDAQPMTIHQVVDRILSYYPSLEVARLNIEKAQLENTKVQAQLSWVLSGQVGYARGVSFVGAETDTYSAGGKLSKQLESGSNVSVSGNYSETDSEYAFSSAIPNPEKTKSLSLDYRMPFGQGDGNPAYQFNQKKAESALTINNIDQNALRDQIASQAVEIYFALADVKLRIENTRESIARAKLLRQFVLRNKEIGITEEIDLLQTEAQIRLFEVNLLELETLQQRQKINLNRLLGYSWDKNIEPVIREINNNIMLDNQNLISKAIKYNHELKKLASQYELTESELELIRDKKKDKLDVVLSIGARNRSGNSAAGGVDETDTVGEAKVEYQNTLDKTGFDAERLQAQIERSRLLKSIELAKHDLEYEIYTMTAEIKSGLKAHASQLKRQAVEKAKLKDAHRRFKIGRTDTNQIIQFETDLLNADLAVKQKSLELTNKSINLALKSGTFWGNTTQESSK